MKGKILKISSNDLYGNTDDRLVAVYACFTQKKYMNKYIIFSIYGENDKNKLYYGSIHLKTNSLVVFSVRDEEINYIKPFIDEYMNDSINETEYELIDLDKIEKIELISYNSLDFDKLAYLEEKYIPKVQNNDKENGKKNKGMGTIFLYILLFILIILLMGISYLHFFPEDFQIELKTLRCTNTLHNSRLEMDYQIDKNIDFDKDDKFKHINVIERYNFMNQEQYLEFKNNIDKDDYFKIDGSYKYNDDDNQFVVMYKENSIMEDYNEILEYLKGEGYECVEGTIYE